MKYRYKMLLDGGCWYEVDADSCELDKDNYFVFAADKRLVRICAAKVVVIDRVEVKGK